MEKRIECDELDAIIDQPRMGHGFRVRYQDRESGEFLPTIKWYLTERQAMQGIQKTLRLATV
jgi:hypothetical protein